MTLNSSADLTVTVIVEAPDADDNPVVYESRAVDVQSGVLLRFESRVRSGRLRGELQIRVQDSQGRTLAVRRVSPGRESDGAFHAALKLDQPLWVTLGKLTVDALAPEAAGRNLKSQPQLVSLDSPRELPAHPDALESVDMLIFPAGRAAGEGQSLFTQLSAEQDSVLRDWVRAGGHLLVSWTGDAAGEQPVPLADWNLSVRSAGQFPLRQLSSFESYAVGSPPLKFAGVLNAARLTRADPQQVLIRDPATSHPLVVSLPYGFGRVTLVALDLETPPLAGWSGLQSVLLRIAGTDSGRMVAGARRTNRPLTHVGVSDLATQLLQTHEELSSVGRPSYWSVMGWILLYVLAIGPIDYFLVHRLLRRPEWTWFTFALMAVGGIGLAAWSAGRINGREFQANQFNLVDVDVASGITRNTTWLSLYSPEHRRYAVTVAPEASSASAAAVPELAWLAAPENSIGGLYRSGAGGFGGREYRFSSDLRSIDDFPISQWSTKNLSATWSENLPEPLVESRLENLGTGQLRGTLTLRGSEPLEDCLLVANGWAYLPANTEARLTPGVEWQLRDDRRSFRQRDLKALLTGERQTRKRREGSGKVDSTEIMTTIEPYQPLGRDRSQQMAMLSFHEATGGSSYTGLSNAALRHLELTDLMKLGRAVLVGRVARSPARVLVDGQPVTPANQSTWVRMVLPVQANERALEKSIPKASEKPIKPESPASGTP